VAGKTYRRAVKQFSLEPGVDALQAFFQIGLEFKLDGLRGGLLVVHLYFLPETLYLLLS
jgi:hypothetical protein